MGVIDLLKIDVEGAEGKVIMGASRTLSITRRVIVELRRGTLWVVDYLRRFGFRLVDYGWRGGYGNFFFVKS
ncbi:FkbM family methyltransferase [Vulcanisaeta thermophila]|uniref:FkbM family methyltransferase n=1 Tax=Vulcanisaeta thermophila TaxID=867917 RepID=UPI00236748C2|nr:FkbM family methyltransferase [Vulcanisaeta thermophila]